MKLEDLIKGGFQVNPCIDADILEIEKTIKDLEKITEDQNKTIEKQTKQMYKNAGTIGVLLDALFLSWDQSLNGNEVADKMRAVAQEYGYCLKCRGYCECDF